MEFEAKFSPRRFSFQTRIGGSVEMQRYHFKMKQIKKKQCSASMPALGTQKRFIDAFGPVHASTGIVVERMLTDIRHARQIPSLW